MGGIEILGFPFVDPFEEAQRIKAAAAAAASTESGPEDGATTGGSKESTPGEGGTGATKPRKSKPRKGVIKVHKVQVDEVPGVGGCPDPYY